MYLIDFRKSFEVLVFLILFFNVLGCIDSLNSKCWFKIWINTKMYISSVFFRLTQGKQGRLRSPNVAIVLKERTYYDLHIYNGKINEFLLNRLTYPFLRGLGLNNCRHCLDGKWYILLMQLKGGEVKVFQSLQKP